MNQKTADYLIELLKELIDKYVIVLEPGSKGSLKIRSVEQEYEFTLDYWISSRVKNKAAFHLRENKLNVSLTRVTLDPNGFHRNADGTRIDGFRLLTYSEMEQKNHPAQNYMRAEPLGQDDFPNQESLIEIFISYLEYNNIINEDKLLITNTIYH